MAKSSPKFYVVWEGKSKGIFDNWEVCKEAVTGYIGAKYKSFTSKKEAEEAFKKGFTYTSQTAKVSSKSQIVANSICVDAACSGNPGLMEYRGVLTISKKEIFRKGPYTNGTNNIGEFLAIVHALALLYQQQKFDTTIYTDSNTAIVWVKNKKPKTTLESNAHNKVLFELLERAVQWLHHHPVKNPIIKWDTEVLGEIPADFGRK